MAWAGSGGRGDPAALGGTVERSQDGTLRMGTGREVGASVRAHGLARGGVRACVRETVCARTFMSVFSPVPAAPGLHTGSGLHTS